jgi:hypothetical protein
LLVILPMLFNNLFSRRWYSSKSKFLVGLIALLIACSPLAKADTKKVSKVNSSITIATNLQQSQSQSEDYSKSDPLNSPHPVPWNWIMEVQKEVAKHGSSKSYYYHTPSLISPDGKYAAYSRISMQAEPELFRSQVKSVMFLENLQTGELQTIAPTIVEPNNLSKEEQEAHSMGKMAILMPVSWSENGDRLLSRQFEGIFSTSDASDWAIVWDRKNNSTVTLTPNRVPYTNAVLLGWSKINPNQVLFSAGLIGEEEWSVWSVDFKGETVLALDKGAIIYGDRTN